MKGIGRHYRELLKMRREAQSAIETFGWIPGVGWFYRKTLMFVEDELRRVSDHYIRMSTRRKR